MKHLNILVAAMLLTGSFSAPRPAFAADVFQRPASAPGHPYPEYYCTNRGVRVDVEQTACLTVDGASFEAKCDISLNNPMWRPTGNACEPVVTTDIVAGGSD